MHIKILLFSFALSAFAQAQYLQKPSLNAISTAPEWAQLMYEDNPNVWEVDQAYQEYFNTHIYQKSYHTQYYKRWRRAVNDHIQSNGYYSLPTDSEKEVQRLAILAAQNSAGKSGNWLLHGPIVTYNTDGLAVSVQANVYSLDQSASDPQILYCGTEPGEVYKSTDGGLSWFNVSLEDPLSGGVYAVEIHPTDPNSVLIGSGGMVYKTIDGGLTWTNVLSGIGRTNEILFIPGNPSVAFAATAEGFYRSSDAGSTWIEVYGDETHDVQLNTANEDIVYIVKKNAAQDRAEFFRSTDEGVSFVQQTSGWYMSTDPNRYDGGARLAVTPADPNRIYAYLIGEAKAGDTGYIGVYRSDDGGTTWTLPNGPAGGPYDNNHMNLAIGSPTWQYHQGYYNCALMASTTNADEILVGGLNLYRSNDGGATFEAVAGYVGGPLDIHVDMQDFRAYGSTYWITTDGGIYRSTDFFNTANFESRMNGIHGSDYWGFSQGWNEDITIGGLYHNGNMTSYESWGQDNFLQLGGGEPASGYVNPGENRRVYSSDINGRILPINIGDPVESVGFGIDPNESYWSVESTELEFHPACYSIALTGKDHQLWITEDKGVTFNLLHSFGTNTNARITYIEYARSNTDVIYVCQQVSGSVGKLWKTVNGGLNWTELTLPTLSNSRKILIQVNPEDESDVWIACASAGNNQKVYQSTDGGASWINRSTALLNGQSARWINYIGGSDGGVYYATDQTIYYRNNTLGIWVDFGDGLPVVMPANIVRPFYRDGKIRIGSYGKGVWESTLYEPQERPVAQISVDKIETTQHCETEPFYYVDNSMLNHFNATWNWTFQGGLPSSSSAWNEAVTYAAPGTYLTILTVTDENGQSDTDSVYITIEPYVSEAVLSENFEGAFPPNNWEIFNADSDITWEKSTAAGGFGLSSSSMIYRGYDYYPGGAEDDSRISLDLTTYSNAELHFDVAYARYAVNYTDSLEVLVSTDCGTNWSSLYFKGGSDLATAPDLGDFFIPTAGQWRSDTIDLTAYDGLNDVWIAFRGHTGWGNNIYLDNINLGGVNSANTAVLEEDAFEVYPTLLQCNEVLHVITPGQDEVQFELYSSAGKLQLRRTLEGSSNYEISLPEVQSGTYHYVVRGKEVIKTGKLVVFN
jgi:photosystem II stability/assembly factor-like uncharacterized protein